MLNKLRLLTPGPTPLPEEVRIALSKDMLHHRKADFKNIMLSIQPKLQTLFGINEPVLPLSSSGTGAMVAAAYSLFNPGEKVLVIDAGKFGERWKEIADSRGLTAEVIKVTWGDAISPELIQTHIKKDSSIKGIFIQLCETSTGILNPIKEIAAACPEPLFIVDGISAVGISPCPMDEWKIDCLLTGSQKGLMLPPGLALIALSKRAWEKARTISNGCYYFNLIRERENIEKGQTCFTSPINLIRGLEAALDLFFKSSLETVYKKQWALTQLIRNGVKALGLELLAKENFAWGITSVLLPPGIDGQEVLKIAQDKYGICMAGGQDNLRGKIVRIGHMGWVDWSDCLAGLYALNSALLETGAHLSSRDYLEQAMAAYTEALTLGAGIFPHEAHIRS